MQKKTVFYYTATGIVFGALFPVSAFLYESISKKIPFSLYGLELAHSRNEVLYIFDFAPLILGLVAWIAGLNLAKNLLAKKEMEILMSKLLNSNAQLLELKKCLESSYQLLYTDSITDNLTGLENRKSFVENFNNNKGGDKDIIIFVLNICHFSEINSIFGYSTGDLILIDFSKRLKENGFDCYRLDGDEFAIISSDKGSFLEVDFLADRIFNLISEEAFLINEEEIFLTIHLGISIINSSECFNIIENNVQEFVHRANFALKYAKENRMQYALYNSELVKNTENSYSYYWKKKIITSIRNDKITAFYQPIINNKTRKSEKFEALMRIEDNNKYISPNDFLLSSKKYGLYNQLTKTVINKALETIERTNCEVSINISIDDIRNMSTMNLIVNKLKVFSKDKTEKIVFELLESEGIENYDEIRKFINIIKKYNCKIAIDDFGSGYSNFSHILNLDIDYIKIDASIIKNINSDKNSEYIAKLIVEFANNIGIKTIAEFVHSKEVFEKVSQLGIDYSQGYYFSEPKDKVDIKYYQI